MASLDDVAQAVSDVFGTVGGVSTDVTFIKGFFSNLSAAGLFSEASLTKLAALIGKIFSELLTAFITAVEGGAKALGEALTNIAKKLATIWETIVAFFQAQFQLAGFPSALERGPIAAVNCALQLTSFVQSLGSTPSMSDRVDVVADSFGELISRSGNKGDLTILSEAIGALKRLLIDLTTSGDNAEKKIRDLLVRLLVPKQTQVVKLLTSVSGGRWWAWAEIPSGLVPGQLHAWINDRGSYTKIANNGTSSPMNDSLVPFARRFRCQVVMVVDGYLRSKESQSNVANPLTNSDGRLSFQSLTDLISGLIDKVIGFVFEPDDFPMRDDDLDGFEDVGLGFALSYARQIRVAIRGSIGLLFRGVWEYSLHSDALIELFASVIGVTLSSIFESVARNLTWSVRLVTRYKGDPFGGQAGFAIKTLDRSSPIAGSGIQSQEVEYVAFLRSKGLVATPIAVGGILQELLRDCAAYTDSCYQRFRAERNFPAVTTDNVGGVIGEIVGKRLTLRAAAFQQNNEFGNLPRPVLRAYFGNQMIVMAPGAGPADNYEMEFQFKQAPRKDVEVTVLSSRGGLGTAIIPVT